MLEKCETQTSFSYVYAELKFLFRDSLFQRWRHHIAYLFPIKTVTQVMLFEAIL